MAGSQLWCITCVISPCQQLGAGSLRSACQLRHSQCPETRLAITWGLFSEGSQPELKKCWCKTSIPKKLACPNLVTPLLQILISTTFNCLKNVKRRSLYTSAMSLKITRKNKILVIIQKKKLKKLKILHRKFCLSKNIFRKLPIQKAGWMDPGKMSGYQKASK